MLQVTDITAAEVKVLLDKAEPLILVDVRTDEEQAVRWAPAFMSLTSCVRVQVRTSMESRRP